MFEITELYAYVAVNDDGEGIVATQIMMNGELYFAPLVTNNLETLKSYESRVLMIGKMSGRNIKLLKFNNREMLAEYSHV